jgi:hypothetical protein
MYCSILISSSRVGTRDKLDEAKFPSILWRDKGQLPKSGHNPEKFDHGPTKKKKYSLKFLTI